VIGGGGAATLALPPATNVAPAPRVIVSLTSKGELFVGGTLVTEAALPAKLRELASRNKDTELVIAADKRTPYARVTSVLDRAKQAGLARVSLAIDGAGAAGPTR
jgi:biopolymer transport protein TolR